MVLSEVSTASVGFFRLVPLVVIIPVVGLLLNIIFGDRLGDRGAGWLASLASGLALVVSILLGVSLIAHPEGQSVPFAKWISIGNLDLSWTFRVNTLSVTMMLVVSGVVGFVH